MYPVARREEVERGVGVACSVTASLTSCKRSSREEKDVDDGNVEKAEDEDDVDDDSP